MFTMKFAFVFCSLLIGISCKDDGQVFLKPHLEKMTKTRHPLKNDGDDWRDAREYIVSIMKGIGDVDVKKQKFDTTVGDLMGNPVQEHGFNIIGIVEPTNSKKKPVLLIGADYDTPITGDPLKNNGGGVACLLEIMRLLKYALKEDSMQLLNTVVFVAFDLNTKEYSSTGNGIPGSSHFVHEYLPNFLKERKAILDAAIILDSITTVNYNENSQGLVSGFDKAFPDANTDIINDGNKGNFLGLVATLNYTENRVRKSIVKNFKKNLMVRPYRLQEMNLHASSDIVVDDVINTINHQAHFHFWTAKDQSYPAFLLFDTDASRKDPSPCDGYCSAREFLTPERERFMSNTVNSLVSVILEIGTEKIEPNSASSLSLYSFFNVIVIGFVAYLFR